MTVPSLYLPPLPRMEWDPVQVAARRAWYGQAEREQACKFCKENGEPIDFYTSHSLRSCDGVVECPVLRSYTCDICHATGDDAHTRSYCPFKPNHYHNAAIYKRTQFSAAGYRRK